MFHESASTAELGKELSFVPFPYTLSRQPLPSIFSSLKDLKAQNSWEKETPSDFWGYHLQCWTIVTKIGSPVRGVQGHMLCPKDLPLK